jgi:Mn-dependent DtxR family transcriptional regulator
MNTNERLIEFVKKNPTARQLDYAVALGISQARVQQIMRRLGYRREWKAPMPGDVNGSDPS